MNHRALVSSFNCTNENGNPDQIILIYSGQIPNAICQSFEEPPKAWVRSGPQSVSMTEDIKEQLKRDKGIVNFENRKCCPFKLDEINEDILTQFLSADNRKPDDIKNQLYNAGALIREGEDYYFNNAGYLFFSNNPQRILKYAHIRLAKFEVEIEEFENRGLPTNERKFEGALAVQILKARAYFKESGFFKIYRQRKIGGGFIEDPEFPPNAIDEAIVNAVAHRDFAIQLPIECLHYKNAFYIENPGKIKQRDQEVPPMFTLEETTLVSTPRNSLLIDWLKQMKDDAGNSFVQKWGEGTKNIKKEMIKSSLPSPLYRTSFQKTSLTLYNNYIEREAFITNISTSLKSGKSEFLNLFKLEFWKDDGTELLDNDITFENQEILLALRNKLHSQNWYIDNYRFGRMKAHQKKSHVGIDASLNKSFMLFPAYRFQIRKYYGFYYLIVDYSVEIKNIKTIERLGIDKKELINLQADIHFEDEWTKGKILDFQGDIAIVQLSDTELKEEISCSEIIPDLPYLLTLKVLGASANSLMKSVKKLGLVLGKNAAKARIDKTLSIALKLSKGTFPIRIKDTQIILDKKAFSIESEGKFPLSHLKEPTVEFRNKYESANIRESITKIGSYDSQPKDIELIPVCLDGYKEHMENLIRRLQIGKFKYKGSEKTFNVRLFFQTVHTAKTAEELLTECNRIIENFPFLIGNDEVNKLFLVHIPENKNGRDDFSSPYFLIKKFLLSRGVPCQMVSSGTLHDPDWKDLNLALNIVAKCGVIPWVLPNRIPDADFFIGLSYTQARGFKKGMPRLIGYANVIDSYGKWKFFSGRTEAFSYDEKRKYFADLARDILKKLDSKLSDSPNIHFHYSSKFKKDDIEAIVSAAREIRPNATFTFVSINFQHLFRLYDDKPETDGSLSRGSYVQLQYNQFLLSTTGFNQYGKTLGTPKPLEATVRVYKPQGMGDLDLRSIAVQLLNLTKLNWASTSSITTEPITIKYASDIAYLTFAFISDNSGDSFSLHPVLEKTPWFL